MIHYFMSQEHKRDEAGFGATSFLRYFPSFDVIENFLQGKFYIKQT